ncbi:2-oxoacid:acceptor oxidoreductase subunit alpha [Methanoplanus sp. FWC-SCC4]|uniref:2-oxoacid:acceptor oxidoreductase subunit alpha n=1 Tax=Methanochimaera problematica TaxID=2609417 RepID=A0AA97FB55_9EURY|nr:2-oxoacid:acceptor oxidoreductase subunit alpha [Methanoplanus sp. FWC-SCC4]WOF15862.1 2-oxoacid:acceptor oxidoreductase subunit alpha [Methanoplanus sp. FWC-SCC4]
MSEDISVLIGGKAGDGINQAGLLISRIFSSLGYFIYMDFDHPSLIKGGHNFCIIRASKKPVGALKEKIDLLIALDNTTVKKHQDKISPDTSIIYNSDLINKSRGTGVPALKIVYEEGGKPVMINSCMIGAFCKSIGLGWNNTKDLLEKEFPHATDVNLRISKKGFDAICKNCLQIKKEPDNITFFPVITGNEAIALGLLCGGIDAYIAYPMSPASGILHFLASKQDDYSIKVIHPEGEIAAILMAEGMAYAGCKAAVGTSGGGFCLMTEGLSFSGIAEIPIVIVLAQRQSPGTGAPTYSAQSDLSFALYAGHGEFPRIVITPSNPKEAFEWSARAVKLSWKYQVPGIIMTDKTLCESTYTFDIFNTKIDSPYDSPNSEGFSEYKRYKKTENGISPMAIPPLKNYAIKVNGKTHDESGLSTDDPEELNWLSQKRLAKEKALKEELENIETVIISESTDLKNTVVSFGSTVNPCREICDTLKIRCVYPVLLSPFPKEKMKNALLGSQNIIVVEDNSTGQLGDLMRCNSIQVNKKILNYTGRQMSIETLSAKIEEVLL